MQGSRLIAPKNAKICNKNEKRIYLIQKYFVI